MHMKATRPKPVKRAKDLRRLREIISPLIGERCWQAGFGYADEVFLPSGARIACPEPVLKGQYEGEWILGTRATPWRLYTPRGMVRSNGHPANAKLANSLKSLQGKTVTGFGVITENEFLVRFGDHL